MTLIGKNNHRKRKITLNSRIPKLFGNSKGNPLDKSHFSEAGRGAKKEIDVLGNF